jgi:hypothetical protein
VVRGAAEILERRGDKGKHGGPGLRQLTFHPGVRLLARCFCV